jgi:hypothetical protein
MATKKTSTKKVESKKTSTKKEEVDKAPPETSKEEVKEEVDKAPPETSKEEVKEEVDKAPPETSKEEVKEEVAKAPPETSKEVEATEAVGEGTELKPTAKIMQDVSLEHEKIKAFMEEDEKQKREQVVTGAQGFIDSLEKLESGILEHYQIGNEIVVQVTVAKQWLELIQSDGKIIGDKKKEDTGASLSKSADIMKHARVFSLINRDEAVTKAVSAIEEIIVGVQNLPIYRHSQLIAVQQCNVKLIEAGMMLAYIIKNQN